MDGVGPVPPRTFIPLSFSEGPGLEEQWYGQWVADGIGDEEIIAYRINSVQPESTLYAFMHAMTLESDDLVPVQRAAFEDS